MLYVLIQPALVALVVQVRKECEDLATDLQHLARKICYVFVLYIDIRGTCCLGCAGAQGARGPCDGPPASGAKGKRPERPRSLPSLERSARTAGGGRRGIAATALSAERGGRLFLPGKGGAPRLPVGALVARAGRWRLQVSTRAREPLAFNGDGARGAGGRVEDGADARRQGGATRVRTIYICIYICVCVGT